MFPERITDPRRLDDRIIERELAARGGVIIQFSNPGYSRSFLRRVDALCARHGQSVEVRFYGHLSTGFDGQYLRELPSVRSLTLDCLQTAQNLEELRGLRHLTRFGLGVFELAQADILEGDHLRSLTSLRVGETRKRNLDLEPISRMTRLRDLTISGQANGLQALAGLPALRELRLSMLARSVGLGFLGGLKPLRRLKLALGGRDDLGELTHPRLETLEISRVRGFSRLDPSAFPRLVELTVQDQLQLKALRFTARNRHLEQVWLLNCKRLASVTGLRALSKLERLRVYVTALEVGRLIGTGLPPTLRQFAFFTGRERADQGIREDLERRGYQAD